MRAEAVFASHSGASGAAFRAAGGSLGRGRDETETRFAMWRGNNRSHDRPGREVRFRRSAGWDVQDWDTEQGVASSGREMRRAGWRGGEIAIRKDGPDIGRLNGECRNGRTLRRL